MIACKQRATDLFRGGDVKGALDVFLEAAAMEATTDEERKAKVVCLGNALTCCIKQEQYEKCISVAVDALANSPNYTKAYAAMATSANALSNSSASNRADDALLALRSASAALLLDEATMTALGCPIKVAASGGSAEEQPPIGLEASISAIAATMIPVMEAALDILTSEAKSVKEAASVEAGKPVQVLDASGRVLEPSKELGGFGRSAVAARTVAPGEVASPLPQPLSVAAYNETYTNLCVGCGATPHDTSSLALCPHCCCVVFCGECRNITQGGALQHHLDAPCRILQQFTTMYTPHAETLSGKQDDIEWRQLATHTVQILCSSRVSKSDSLQSVDPHPAERSSFFSQFLALLASHFPEKQVLHCLRAVHTNAIEVSDRTGQPVGSALYPPPVPFFNHSCSPNCRLIFDGTVTGQVAVSSCMGAKPGAEMCISYIPHLHWPVEYRRQILQERYAFKCHCKRCITDDSQIVSPQAWGQLLRSPPEYHKRVTKFVDYIRGCDVGTVDKEMLREALKLQKEFRQGTLLHAVADSDEARGVPGHGLMYLAQDIQNILTFVCTALDDVPAVISSCFIELLFWEVASPGNALPSKVDKLVNMRECMKLLEKASKGSPPRVANAHRRLLEKWCALYGL